MTTVLGSWSSAAARPSHGQSPSAVCYVREKGGRKWFDPKNSHHCQQLTACADCCRTIEMPPNSRYQESLLHATLCMPTLDVDFCVYDFPIKSASWLSSILDTSFMSRVLEIGKARSFSYTSCLCQVARFLLTRQPLQVEMTSRTRG